MSRQWLENQLGDVEREISDAVSRGDSTVGLYSLRKKLQDKFYGPSTRPTSTGENPKMSDQLQIEYQKALAVATEFRVLAQEAVNEAGRAKDASYKAYAEARRHEWAPFEYWGEANRTAKYAEETRIQAVKAESLALAKEAAAKALKDPV